MITWQQIFSQKPDDVGTTEYCMAYEAVESAILSERNGDLFDELEPEDELTTDEVTLAEAVLVELASYANEARERAQKALAHHISQA